MCKKGMSVLITLVITSFSSALFAIDAVNSATAGARTGSQNVAAVAESVKNHYKPLSYTDLVPVYHEVWKGWQRLDQWLTKSGENGKNWRTYLDWNAVQAELLRPTANHLKTLDALNRKLSAGHEGLRLVWFIDVQRPLKNYLDLSRTVNNPKFGTMVKEQIDTLTRRYEEYNSTPTPENYRSLTESIRWLSNARQAPELIAEVQKGFSAPNLYARISAEVVGVGLGDRFDDSMHITDCILGTSISGTARTIAQTQGVLANSTDGAYLDTLLTGTTFSNTVGRNGPVLIYSNSTTQLSGLKRILLTENGLFPLPAVSNACTDTTICDIVSIKGRALVEKIAWKKAHQQLSQAEQIASQHAAARLNQRMDSQALTTLEETNQNFQKKFRRPLDDHKLFPEMLKFSSTGNELQVVSRVRGQSLLAGPLPPPPATEPGDITFVLHESMVNNFLYDAIGGMTIREKQFQNAVMDTFGALPEKLKGDPDDEPWAITFAKKQPISVTFAENGYSITMHGTEYYRGENAYPGMDVTAQYKFEKTAEGFKAVRQGELEIFPPDFKTGEQRQLSVREQTIRTLLHKRFDKVFDKEMVGKGFYLSGKWEKAGHFMPVQLTSDKGWLVIVWKRSGQ